MKTFKLLFSTVIVLSCFQLFAEEHKQSELKIPNGSRSLLIINQLSDGPLSASDLVTSILPAGTPFSNVNYAAPEGLGYFSGGYGANLDINQGVLFGCGCLNDINSGDLECNNMGLNGDADLDGLGSGYNTYDAAVLEFDFVPAFNTLQFQIIYATAESIAFWDEPCAIFLDGSNIALLPGGGDEISTRTWWGSPYFFLNNDIDAYLYAYSSVISVSAPVTPGEPHHLKIAIADGKDHSVNTYLFVEGTPIAPPVPFAWWSVVLGLALIIGFTSYRFITIHRG